MMWARTIRPPHGERSTRRGILRLEERRCLSVNDHSEETEWASLAVGHRSVRPPQKPASLRTKGERSGLLLGEPVRKLLASVMGPGLGVQEMWLLYRPTAG